MVEDSPQRKNTLSANEEALCTIFRILGNDLPPLHGSNQTYENTRFIIDNEPRHENTTRKWVLNRIGDTRKQSRLIELLEQHDEEFIVIPFERDHFLAIDDSDAEIEDDIARHLEKDKKSFQGWPLDNKDRTTLVKLHRKVLYLMNINGARNVALRTGKTAARWVAPLDSGCYLPALCWDLLRRHLERANDIHYMAVPLIRLRDTRIDNLETLDDSTAIRFVQNGIELETSEPQLLFHRGSIEEFDEIYRYGRRDKIELLVRLGLYKSVNDALALRSKHGSSEKQGKKAAFGGVVFRLPYRHSEEETRALFALKQERCASAIKKADSVREQLERWLGMLTHSEKAIGLRQARLETTQSETKRKQLMVELAHFTEREAVCEKRLKFHKQRYANARATLAESLQGTGDFIRNRGLNGTDLRLTPGDIWVARSRSIARALTSLSKQSAALQNKVHQDLSAQPSPQTFVLYRILGNDLPPRHASGQTARNLRFIIENEPDFQNCTKKWVVNRIADRRQENETIHILERAGQEYLHIPYSDEEYQKVGFNFEDFSEPGYFFTDDYRCLTDEGKRQALACQYRLKALYVMNNNGARNAALRDGRHIARWILPWDGNCFLTREAWDEIEYRLHYSDGKYFIVPMSRLLKNEDLLDTSFQPMPVEEPQIIFRQDAAAEFDESIPYGYRSKVILLQRLGVPGMWDQWAEYPWDHFDRSPYADADPRPETVSWVARLASGVPQQEHYSQASRWERAHTRHHSMFHLFMDIDVRLARKHFDADRLFAYREAILEKDRRRNEGAPDRKVNAILISLRQAADEALKDTRYTVVDKTEVPPKIDLHDYWNPAATWWPDPAMPDGIPYVHLPERRRDGTGLETPDCERYDRTRMQRMFDNTTILALAWYFTSDERYAQRAAENIRTWFLAENTAMSSHLRYAQARLGWPDSHSNAGVRESRDFYFFLDAVRLIRRSSALSEREYDAMRKWCGKFLDWLMSSDKGTRAARRFDVHGIDYDLQTASLAAFVGDLERFLECMRNTQMRIGHQFHQDGSSRNRRSDAKPRSEHRLDSLQSWANLCRITAAGGIELLNKQSKDGYSLQRAFKHPFAHADDGWLSAEGHPHRIVLWYHVYQFLPNLKLRNGLLTNKFDMPSRFGWRHGIRPFWQLGF